MVPVAAMLMRGYLFGSLLLLAAAIFRMRCRFIRNLIDARGRLQRVRSRAHAQGKRCQCTEQNYEKPKHRGVIIANQKSKSR